MSDTNIYFQATRDCSVMPQCFDPPGGRDEGALDQRDGFDVGEGEAGMGYHVLHKSGKVPFAFLDYLVGRLNTSGKSVVVLNDDLD